ncbi:MAG: DUF2249 domain-containing protein [Cytophagaceae bacterium]
MEISAQTTISKIIEENKQAIDVISSINPHFKKLKNPIFRKLLASMVTVEQAAKIGGVHSSTILNSLKDIGFKIINNTVEEELIEENQAPFYVDQKKLFTLDVRPYLQEGEDPFAIIMKSIKKIPSDYTLLLINSFEPVPLIAILKKQGYAAYVKKIDKELYETYFYRQASSHITPMIKKDFSFDELLQQFNSNVTELDVRGLEMPTPMVLTLNKITELQKGHSLLVHHHKIPIHLFPKLDELQLLYAFKQVQDGDVWILIVNK